VALHVDGLSAIEGPSERSLVVNQLDARQPVRTSVPRKGGLTNLRRQVIRCIIVRVTALLLFFTSLATAESHPAWWTYASPEATALVGIRWETLRLSPFAAAISSELADGGSLRFPDLACLREAQQFIISSPALLAMVTGNFPTALLREQATHASMKAATYRSIPLWVHPSKETLSVAVISEHLLLVASHRSLEAAIDRTDPESARPANRRYSPLLPRAARFSHNADLWVIATRLPDPLASLFVPIEADAKSFEGSLSLREGLHLEAVLEAGSPDDASGVASELRKSIPSLPAIARGLQVAAAESSVVLALDVSREQLAAGWREQPVVVAELTSQGSVPESATTVDSAPVPAIAPVPNVASAPSRTAPIEASKPEPPQIIRIIGLDDGPREIILPPVKKQ